MVVVEKPTFSAERPYAFNIMIIRVDPDAALPVYEQIRTQIRRMAVGGVLPAGTRLPTIRQLAADLGLAKGTVSKAYELLDAERLIETRGRKGTFIAEMTVPNPVDAKTALDRAAEAFAVIAHQMGASREETTKALSHAWTEIESG